MSQFSIAIRVWCLTVIVLGLSIVTAVTGWVVANRLTETAVKEVTLEMRAGHRIKLKNMVDAQSESLGASLQNVEGEEAQAEYIRHVLHQVDYNTVADTDNQDGYFFVYDLNAVNVANKPDPSLVGRNLWDTQDENGVYIFRELIVAAKGDGGYVEYIWQKGNEGLQPKLSYARMIPGTPFLIGTGVYIDDEKAKADQMAGQMKARQAQMVFYGGLIVLAYLVVIVVPLTIYMIRFTIQMPLKQLITRMRDLAEGEGDLTQRMTIKGKDEIAVASSHFNAFMDKLHTAISDVVIVSSNVENASSRLNETASEVRSAIDQNTQAVSEIAGQSSDAANVSERAGQTANDGGEIIGQTIHAIRSSAESVESSSRVIAGLGEKSREITKVIQVINEIADQTNLLALNAAIEAARAGEHGRGFAVVADEVRALAERTVHSTAEVSKSITEIQKETEIAIKSMQSVSLTVDDGVKSAQQAEEALQEIVASSQEVNHMIHSIAAAAEESSTSGEQINQSMDMVSGNGHEPGAVGELYEQSTELQRILRQFKV